MLSFFRTKTAPAVAPVAAPVVLSGAHAPSAAELSAAGLAFVGRYLETAPAADARVLELAGRNGSITITIKVSPTPGITINVDPGRVSRIEIPTTPTTPTN